MNHPCDRRTERRTDRQTDGRNCDSISVLTVYAVARKNQDDSISINPSTTTEAGYPAYGDNNIHQAINEWFVKKNLVCRWDKTESIRWGIIIGPPWFLLYSIWTNRWKLVKFSRNDWQTMLLAATSNNILNYWLSLCSKCLPFTLLRSLQKVTPWEQLLSNMRIVSYHTYVAKHGSSSHLAVIYPHRSPVHEKHPSSIPQWHADDTWTQISSLLPDAKTVF